MPFARRWMERHAWEEREARLSIVDDAGVDGGWDMTPEQGKSQGNHTRLFGPASRAAPACPITKLQFP